MGFKITLSRPPLPLLSFLSVLIAEHGGRKENFPAEQTGEHFLSLLPSHTFSGFLTFSLSLSLFHILFLSLTFSGFLSLILTFSLTFSLSHSLSLSHFFFSLFLFIPFSHFLFLRLSPTALPDFLSLTFPLSLSTVSFYRAFPFFLVLSFSFLLSPSLWGES